MQNSSSHHSISSLNAATQRPGGKALPPLSKYYYGPAQTRSSSEKSLSSGTISASPVNASTTPPSFQSPPLSTPSFPQSPNSSTPWQLPGPPPSAPPLSQVIFASYSPSTYGPMPGARQSPVNPGFYQGGVSLSSSDTSRWGVKYNHQGTSGGAQGSKPPLPPRLNDSFQGPNQPQTISDAQTLLLSGTQPKPTPELLQPVAYSPIPPQIMTDGYQPNYENDDSMMPSNAPPQRAPPPPPLKLPLTDSDELQSHKKPQPIHAPYSPQPGSHQSKSSLDHELRQYQQYSERIHKLADSSVESLISYGKSYGKSRAENESCPPQVEQHSIPNAKTNESDKHQSGRQEQAILIEKASGDDARSDPTRGGENPEITSRPFSLSMPSISSGQHHSNTVPSLSGTAILLPPASSTMHINPSQPALQNKHSLAQTKDHDGNETGRRSNDSLYRHTENSHHSSCSLSEEESQLRSADAVPPHSIINRPNPKIISIVSNQRRSEPTRNLSPMVSQPRGHHSASALGFGGPSDWEHFGDYEAEEIDDTDLYSRSKPETATNAAELPVDVAPIDKQQSPIQSDQGGSDGNAKDSPPSTLQDIASVRFPKPGHCLESPKPEYSVESPKPEHDFESPKPELNDESPKPELNVESPKPEHSVESLKSEHSVESPKPEHSVESPKPEHNGESPKPENSVESPEPEHSVESPKPEHSVESPKPEYSVESPKPGHSAPKPEHSVESPKPEKAWTRSGDENSKTPGTESQVEAKAPDSTRPQSSQIKTEKGSPQRQSLDVDEVIKAWSEDSTKGKAHEYQPPASPHLVDREPSCDQPVKPLRENQTESLSSGDTSSDKPLDPPQQSQDKLPLSRLSLNQLNTPVLAEEAAAVPQTPHFQAPNHGAIDLEDGRVSPMAIENALEVKQFNINQELPKDQVISREREVTASSGGQNSDSRRGMIEKIITTTPIEPSDSTTTDRSSTSLTLSPGESTLHQSSLLKEGKSLRSTEIDDMFADLDPWGRASLHRYMLMLLEEAKAKTDLEKFKAFTVFANRETKLRAVLYAADDDATIMQTSLNGDGPKDLADPTAKHSEKALPALPPEDEPLGGQPLERSPEQTVSECASAIVHEDVKILLTIDTPSVGPQHSTDGSLLPPQESKGESLINPAPELKTPRERVNKVWTQFASYIYPTQSSSPEMPKTAVSENAAEPQKPAYVPYKYNQTEAEISNYLSKRQSAYRPYAALTMSSLDGGLRPTTESTNKKGTTVESFISEVQEESRQKDQIFEPATSSSEIAKLLKNGQIVDKPDLRRFVKSDFDPLSSVLPSSGVIIQDSAELQELHGSMDAFPDDFSFIRQSVMAWDAVAKKERERFERERHIRQGDSERKIDELFDDHEIGYGDISELEAEFKQSEASRKADEDRHEYHTFLSNVFDVVWTRLHYEIDHLTPLYNKYTTSIKDSLVGKDMFEVSTARFTLAPLMSALLAFHQKLEVRHQKAFEAVLERDRRLKKTEISAWYTLGNVSKVKELEKQFEYAEKNAIVAYCQHRDERANKLMDVLDHNTLRGVGANQDYMECLMKAVRRVASGRAFASIPSSDSGIGVEEVKKAKSITTALSTSSEQIVRTFHVADMLLNAADYELSVAKAKLVNADAGMFKQLKEERTKEDQKLMRDLEHRLALIREDTRSTHDEVAKLLVFLGIENGHPEIVNTIPEIVNTIPETIPRSETEQLVQKALNNAKKISASEGSEE